MVRRTILGPCTRIHSYSCVEESILFEGVEVGRHAKIRRAIIEKSVRIPPRATIGFDLDKERRRGLPVTKNGIVVIPKFDGIEELLARDP